MPHKPESSTALNGFVGVRRHIPSRYSQWGTPTITQWSWKDINLLDIQYSSMPTVAVRSYLKRVPGRKSRIRVRTYTRKVRRYDKDDN